MDKSSYRRIVIEALEFAAGYRAGESYAEKCEEAQKMFESMNPKPVEQFKVYYCEMCGVLPQKDIHNALDGSDICRRCGCEEVSHEVVKAMTIRNDAVGVANDSFNIAIDADADVEDNNVDGYWVQARVFVNYE